MQLNSKSPEAWHISCCATFRWQPLEASVRSRINVAKHSKSLNPQYSAMISVTFGHFWSPLVTFGHLWSPLVTFGHLWSPLVSMGVTFGQHGQFPVAKEVAISGWLLKRCPAFGPDHWNKQWCVLYEDQDWMADDGCKDLEISVGLKGDWNKGLDVSLWGIFGLYCMVYYNTFQEVKIFGGFVGIASGDWIGSFVPALPTRTKIHGLLTAIQTSPPGQT